MRMIVSIIGLSVILSACVPVTPPRAEVAPDGQPVLLPSVTPEGEPLSEGERRINVRVDDPNSYRFPQLLPMDGIRPVYNPEFMTADQVELKDDELILGVTFEGQAKAYPITVLRSREMVNDELAGIPLLVTW